MDNLIVEVGMKLDKSFNYYEKILINNGFKKVFKCKTHDVYYTREKTFDGLSENKIKTSCIRIRNHKKKDKLQEKKLIKEGYFKIFDTSKKDYHFKKEKINGIVQLQIIKDIGLVVYYDNPDYYKFSLKKQRHLLLKDLNSFGFSFNINDLGIDKLRTLYYKTEKYSENQNG